MKKPFDFERADRAEQSGAPVPFSQPHLALLRAEDAAALVAHTAKLRRQLLRLSSAATGDLSSELCDLSPQRATQIGLTLITLNNTMNLVCDWARDLDELARDAHAACYEPARPSRREAARPADVSEDETARDDDDAGEAGAPASPALADRPKVPVSDECNRLRRQFWAVVHKAGLSSLESRRDERIGAIGDYLGHALDSINRMTPEEWSATIYAIEDGRLDW